MKNIASRCGISTRPGYNIRKEIREMGKPTALYRVRKQKAESKGTKLGRPFRITQETLDEMCKGKNPVRWKPLAIQGVTGRYRIAFDR